MSTPHINAEKGDFAETVLMPGDPYRAEFIAKNFLDGARLVNDVRAVKGYTGTYRGKPVSVMASGMGMPSIGIYSYELFNFFDVDNIIRIGSAGSYSENVKLRDIVIAEGACTDSNYAGQFGRRHHSPPQPISGYCVKRLKPPRKWVSSPCGQRIIKRPILYGYLPARVHAPARVLG